MWHKLKYAFYYLFVQYLPQSWISAGANRFRVWYVAKILKLTEFDKGTKIEPHVYFSDGKSTRLGRNCQINQNVFIQEAHIGENVLIAPNVAILSVNHQHDRTDIPIVEQGNTDPAPPIIKDGAWLGRNVVVLPGITIGKGAIVAAGAVVINDVEDCTIVGGVPAKFIKQRGDET